MKKILALAFGIIILLVLIANIGTVRSTLRQLVTGSGIERPNDNPRDTAPVTISSDVMTEEWTYPMQATGNNKDEIDGVAVDSAGNIFMGGPFEGTVEFNDTKHTAKSGVDIHLSKISPEGKEIWFRNIDSGGDDYMWDMEAAPGDDIYISGGYSGTLTVKGVTYSAAKDGSAYFARVDGKTGDIEWLRTAGVPNNGTGLIDSPRTAGGNEIKVDSEGNAHAILSMHGDTYRIGEDTYQGRGHLDSFIVKLSPEGEWIWIYEFEGSGDQQGRSIALTGDDSVIVGYELIGTLSSREGYTVTTPTNKTPQGAFGLISKDGDLLWLKSVSSNGFANTRGAGGDSKGNVYITGEMAGEGTIAGQPITSDASSAQYIAKLDAKGNLIWAQLFASDEENNGGEMVTFEPYVAISGATGGANVGLYTQTGKSINDKIFVTPNRKYKATLAIFDMDGTLVTKYEPVATDLSFGGVLEYDGNSCIIFQHGFAGNITYNNKTTYTALPYDPKDFGMDSALAKVCF